MDPYTSLIAEPPLTDTETLLARVVWELDTQQLVHRFYDPQTPASPSFWQRIFLHRQAMQDWEEAWERYDTDFGRSIPLAPLPLDQLWAQINRTADLEPNVANRNNLFFDNFFVAQRFLGSPSDRELSYIVAGPLAGKPSRCLAYDCSGRFFCTTEDQTHCDPPEEGDFDRLRIRADSSDAVDEAAISPVYLPECYGSWNLLAAEKHANAEQIIRD